MKSRIWDMKGVKYAMTLASQTHTSFVGLGFRIAWWNASVFLNFFYLFPFPLSIPCFGIKFKNVQQNKIAADIWPVTSQGVENNIKMTGSLIFSVTFTKSKNSSESWNAHGSHTLGSDVGNCCRWYLIIIAFSISAILNLSRALLVRHARCLTRESRDIETFRYRAYWQVFW